MPNAAMFLKRPVCLVVALSIMSVGCATASKDIASAYVSPIQYQSYDCEQISAESQRIHGRVTQLGGRLDEASSNDKAIMGVGLILFWPALFALGGTKQQEAEYGRLKGEHEALQQAAIQRRCAGAVASAGGVSPQAIVDVAPSETQIAPTAVPVVAPAN